MEPRAAPRAPISAEGLHDQSELFTDVARDLEIGGVADLFEMGLDVFGTDHRALAGHPAGRDADEDARETTAADRIDLMGRPRSPPRPDR